MNTIKQRRGYNIATVALANKNARVLWALPTRGELYSAAPGSFSPSRPWAVEGGWVRSCPREIQSVTNRPWLAGRSFTMMANRSDRRSLSLS